MEPPTPTNWSRSVTQLALATAIVVTVLCSTPVIAQDDTEPTASFDTDADVIVLETGPEQTITGTTSLDEGTSVTVRMRSVNGSEPFLKSAKATVEQDGEFTAVFDTTGIVPANSTARFTVTLSTANTSRITEAEGVIVGDNAECTTETPSKTSTTSPESTTTPGTTAANAPGFGTVVAFAGLVLAGGLLTVRQG